MDRRSFFARMLTVVPFAPAIVRRIQHPMYIVTWDKAKDKDHTAYWCIELDPYWVPIKIHTFTLPDGEPCPYKVFVESLGPRPQISIPMTWVEPA